MAKKTAEELRAAKNARKRRYYAKHKKEICAKMKAYRETPYYKEYAKGYRERTKQHKAEYGKEYYRRNIERIKARDKRYKEAHKEQIRAYAVAHREEHTAYMREYRARNREKVREWNRAYDRKRKASKQLYWVDYIKKVHERWDTDAEKWSEKRKKDRVRVARKKLAQGVEYKPNVRRRVPDYLNRTEYQRISEPVRKGWAMSRDAIERGVKWTA